MAARNLHLPDGASFHSDRGSNYTSGDFAQALTDLGIRFAVAVADGADAISGIAVLEDRQGLLGPVASVPATWRVLDRIDALICP